MQGIMRKKNPMLKMFFGIALPVAFQNFLTYAVGLADTIMVGALGEEQLSAVTAANQPFFLFMMCIFGLSSGAGVLISQYWGKKDKETISKVFGVAIKVSMIIGLVTMLLVLIFPEQVMKIYTNETHVIPYGVSYLRIVVFSYIFFAFTSSYINCIRSVERVRIAVVTFSISFVVNVFFNYVFIFGAFGAPEMGVAGAAVGTLFARITEFIIVMIYANKIETRVKLHIKNIIKNDKLIAKDFFRFSAPVMVNEMMWAFGTSAHIAILGRMGVTALASVSVVTSISQIMTVVVYGAASATLVIIGKQIGARKYELAKKSAPKLIVMTMSIAAISAVGLILLRPAFIGLYSLNDSFSEITKIAINTTLLVNAGIMLFQSINLACIVGVLRGGGDTLFCMWVDVLSIWLVSVPLGAIGGLAFGASIPITYLLLRSDEIVKAVICLARIKSGKWLRNITRDETGAIGEAKNELQQ